MKSISLKVEGIAGASIETDIIPDMIQLALQLGIGVEARCNGVTIIVSAGDDPADVWASFQHQRKLPEGSARVAFAYHGKRLRQA